MVIYGFFWLTYNTNNNTYCGYEYIEYGGDDFVRMDALVHSFTQTENILFAWCIFAVQISAILDWRCAHCIQDTNCLTAGSYFYVCGNRMMSFSFSIWYFNANWNRESNVLRTPYASYFFLTDSDVWNFTKMAAISTKLNNNLSNWAYWKVSMFSTMYYGDTCQFPISVARALETSQISFQTSIKQR